MTSKAQILLVGYGAVGFVVAYALEKSGRADVAVVARSNFEAAAKGSIVLKSSQYGDIDGWMPSRVYASVREAAKNPYDYVVVATKAIPELCPTPVLLADLLSANYKHPQPSYIVLQNGLGVEKDLGTTLLARGDERPAPIVSCALYVLTNRIGEVVTHGTQTKIEAGLYRLEGEQTDQNTEGTERMEEFVSICKSGGITASISSNIQGAKFKKNMWNASFASLTCLTRTPNFALWNDEKISNMLEPLLREITAELINIGHGLGYNASVTFGTPDSALEANKDLFKLGPKTHKSSTLIDVEQGKPFELEVILGEVIRQGHQLALSIPRLEMAYALLYVTQQQHLQAYQTRFPTVQN